MKKYVLFILAVLAFVGQPANVNGADMMSYGKQSNGSYTIAIGKPKVNEYGNFVGSYLVSEYMEVAAGEEFIIPDCDVIVAGYKFSGWTEFGSSTVLEPSEYARVYQPSEKYTPSSDVTLMARYLPLDISLSDNADNGDVLEEYNGMKATRVTLSGRTLYRDNTWNTLCLPFSLDNLIGTPLEGAHVKELSSSYYNPTGTLTLNFSDDLTAIEAGHPYIVRWESGLNITDPSFEQVTISSTTPTPTVTDAATFVGIFSPYYVGKMTYPVAVLEGDKLTFKMSDNPADGINSWSVEDTGMSPNWISDNIDILEVTFEPSFAKARPKTCRRWFYNLLNLRYIHGLEYLNTSEVKDMSYMFNFLYNLYTRDVDFSHFNTEKVEAMEDMFGSCPFVSLDLTSFNTANVKNMARMFRTCPYLKNIYVSDKWTTLGVLGDKGENMFYDCVLLTGGAGTTFDSNNIDVDYAHIDEGPHNPGYLTYGDAPEQSSIEIQTDDEEGDPTMLYMGADNMLYYPNAPVVLNSFRGYFRLADGLTAADPESGVQNVKSFVLNFDDESTGINLNTDSSVNGEDSGYYTINGQRLNSMPTKKGVYIVNGKKVVIK